MVRTHSGVEERLVDASSVLLLAPSLSETECDVCTDLLRPHDAANENVLWVSYTRSPDAQLRRWRTHADARPAAIGIVSVGESMRAVGAVGSDAGAVGSAAGPIETVANPNDLTGLGIAINEYLLRWEGNGNRTIACFDSLTALLQYVELETAYEFLHVLTGHLYAADAVAHFHMDPNAHESRAVESVASLCDAVVDLRGAEPSVRSR
ncbi:DUF7504 family protein [Halegenticoccus tardaugens]|uniref:DUF7504 family protein n=1 Tax=Halegenticoccus tardaugens TaxID=2071624 RepID=UPI00100B7A0D|nr:hypothetical protein [Halegenticoccus tardaugens]